MTPFEVLTIGRVGGGCVVPGRQPDQRRRRRRPTRTLRGRDHVRRSEGAAGRRRRAGGGEAGPQGRPRDGPGFRSGDSGLLDGDVLPVDLAANASSLGADVLHATSVEELRSTMEKAKTATRTTVVHVETDLYGPNPPGHGSWDVPVSEVSALDSARAAYETYAAHKQTQRHYL